MDVTLTNSPLSDTEFDHLGAFLKRADAMNMETLDGYFTALICGPEIVSSSEYLPGIWGEDFYFDSPGEMIEIMDLLMRHWNTIVGELNQTLKKDDVYLPCLAVGTDGIATGNDWALGFMHGMNLRYGSWRELIESEEKGGPIIYIMILAHEHDADPTMRPPPVPADRREEILMHMIAGVTRIYRYFEPHRQRAFQNRIRHPVTRRAGGKVGRNEPCPCGSGLKYKRCCSASSNMIMH